MHAAAFENWRMRLESNDYGIKLLQERLFFFQEHTWGTVCDDVNFKQAAIW